jgi:hypothetical protein
VSCTADEQHLNYGQHLLASCGCAFEVRLAKPHRSAELGVAITWRILMPLEVVIIIIVAIVAGTGSGVLRILLNRPRRAALPQADLEGIRDGLGQLQQAVDAIAVEVERLSEGQRFTTKLLSKQAREVAPTPPGVRES